MTKPNDYIEIKKYICLLTNCLSDQISLQRSLITDWITDLQQEQGKTCAIPDSHISFRWYFFSKYPDQDKLKAYIRDSFTNSENEIYWAGTAYEDYETLYNELSKQKRVLELTVYEIED